MFYHLSQNINCSIYNDTAIFLDTNSDNYHFIDIGDHKLLCDILLSMPICCEDLKLKYKDLIEDVEHLVELNIFSKSEYAEKNIWKIKKINSPGIANADWRINEKDIIHNESINFKDFFYTYLVLIKIHTIMKLLGLRYMIKSLRRKSVLKKNKYNAADQDTVHESVKILNLVAFYFPFRVKCLEWSFALHTLLTKQSQKSYVKIGVQNNPFISHAWVEIENKVIADAPLLPKKLATILIEPQNNL